MIHLCNSFPKSTVFDVFSRLLIRCSSSIGANYRAACRAKSGNDFINKLKIVEEETDETIYFLELVKEIYDKDTDDIEILIKEANELLAIIVSSIITARKNNQNRNSIYSL